MKHPSDRILGIGTGELKEWRSLESEEKCPRHRIEILELMKV